MEGMAAAAHDRIRGCPDHLQDHAVLIRRRRETAGGDLCQVKVINALERGAWNAALDVPAGVEYGGGLKEEAQQVG